MGVYNTTRQKISGMIDWLIACFILMACEPA